MLCNNLDPEVAERPQDLVVYGGTGKAARDWPAFHAIVAALRRLADDETLLVQSGKPVGVFSTHEYAPRVLIANSLLVPRWATWDDFRELERLGLIMYGQMTAGSWIYIGSQGILQGTFETFNAVAASRFEGSLSGRVVLTSGLGGMGGAQPLAITMNGGVALCVEVDATRVERRLRSGYLDRASHSLDEALRWAEEARSGGQALSIGVSRNAAEVYPELVRRGFQPDVVTDQTSAHDPLRGYIPSPLSAAEAEDLRQRDPEEYLEMVKQSLRTHVGAMLEFRRRGAEVFDYGNNLRGEARAAGVDHAFEIPGFVPAYIRPLFCEGKGPFRWVALSGEADDIYRTDAAVREVLPDNEPVARWLRLARDRVQFQGLPARICWLGYGERAEVGLRFNAMVKAGTLRAPIVIGRDHLDAGSVASPYRETERMDDGSVDAIRNQGGRVVDVQADRAHHRSVVTFVAEPEAAVDAVMAGARVACERIDLRRHQGEHPRMGAIDVVPFVPFADLPMGVCVDLAHRFGARLLGELGIPVYYYGEAARNPERRELERVRRGGFEDLREHILEPERQPDEGPAVLHPSAGATAVGARIPLIAYNVNLRTTDIGVAKEIARKVRASSGGMPNVKALGFDLQDRGLVQVSMNLTDYRVTNIWKVFDAIRREAERRGVEVAESEIVGTIPLDAAVRTVADAVLEPRLRMDQILEKRVWAAE